MTVSVGDIIEVAARAEFLGVEDVVNVFQFKMTSGAPIPDGGCMVDLGTFLDNIYTPIAGRQSTDFIYRDLKFRNVTQDTLMGTTPWIALTTGTQTPFNNPPGVAGVINMATNVAKVILRKYIGGLLSVHLDSDGTFTSGLVAILLAFGNALLQGYSSGGSVYEYGHFSPKTLNWEVPVAATATDIPGYQRRRKQGRGV